MIQSKNPFFKLEDFQSLEVTVEGKNVTSEMRLPPPIHLIELHDDGLTLDLSPRSCADGHTLALDISLKKVIHEPDESIENKIHILGVIHELETMTDSRLKIRIKFRQYAQEEWKALIAYFSEKQHSINTLIKSSRK